MNTQASLASLSAYLPLAEALASATRLRILELVAEQPRNIAELAKELGMSSASVAVHVQQLETVGLVGATMVPGRRGMQKVCSLRMGEVKIPLGVSPQPDCYRIEMPVGQYVDWSVQPPCGLAGPDAVIGCFDEPRFFADPTRVTAGMVWYTSGYLTYRFPNYLLPSQRPIALEFSMEIASEAPGYNPVWPSDIHFIVNGQAAGMWTSPGDFGGRRGFYTPAWVSEEINQYGLYKVLRIDERGTLIDGIPIAPLTIDALQLDRQADITLCLAVPATAQHVGGLTLFGQGFGNYGQHLQLRLYHTPRTR